MYAGEPKLGASAPDISLTAWVQAPDNAPKTLSGLRGNIVVVDFWTTQCSSCRPALKNLSVLAEKFADKPVRFVALSYEKQSLIESYIKSNPTKLWMGIDTTSAAFKSYGVRVLSHTVVIDKSGNLFAVTEPAEITEQRINDLLAGKKVTFKKRLTITADDIMDKEAKTIDTTALPTIVFKPCQSATEMTMWGGGDIRTEMKGVTQAQHFLMEAYQIPYIRVIDSLQSEQQYYIHLLLPKTTEEAFRKVLASVVESSLNIEVRPEKQKRTVAVLQRKAGTTALVPSQAAKKDYGFQGYTFTAIKQPMTKLVSYLNNDSKILVVDETDLQGEYDMSFTWVEGTREALDRELAKLGLERITAEREIEMYVFKHKTGK